MRACGMLIALCLLGCDSRGPPAADPPRSVADPARSDAAPGPIAPASETSSVGPYREAALAAARADYERQMSLCVEAEDVAACETSAASALAAAEQSIRLEDEARLQEEARLEEEARRLEGG